MGRRSIKRSTSDAIRALSLTFQSTSFNKDDVSMEQRRILGALSRRGYLTYNKSTGTYKVTPEAHSYVKKFTGGDNV